MPRYATNSSGKSGNIGPRMYGPHCRFYLRHTIVPCDLHTRFLPKFPLQPFSSTRHHVLTSKTIFGCDISFYFFSPFLLPLLSLLFGTIDILRIISSLGIYEMMISRTHFIKAFHNLYYLFSANNVVVYDYNNVAYKLLGEHACLNFPNLKDPRG